MWHVRGPRCKEKEHILLASRLEAEILAEKRQDVVLEPVGYPACVRPCIDFKRICDSVLIQSIVQFSGIGSKAVLVSHIYCDRAVLVKIADVLIDESQLRIGGPFREDVWLRRAVFDRKVEVERRIFGVWRPGSSCGQLSTRKERQLRRVFRRLYRL